MFTNQQPAQQQVVAAAASDQRVQAAAVQAAEEAASDPSTQAAVMIASKGAASNPRMQAASWKPARGYAHYEGAFVWPFMVITLLFSSAVSFYVGFMSLTVLPEGFLWDVFHIGIGVVLFSISIVGFMALVRRGCSCCQVPDGHAGP